MPAHRRFQIKDQVNKRRNTSGGVSLEICSDVGEVISIREKKNKKGTPCVYCTVRWEKDNRTSEHAQHILVLAPIEKKSPASLAPADFSLSETDKTAYYGS